MSDDLVKRLREFTPCCGLHCEGYDKGETDPDCLEAADRIEELERHVELRDIFLVENGLWERFAKGAQVKTND